MENKYYTPEIGEFYFGFEYQEDDNNSNNWKKQIVGEDNIGDLDYFDDLIIEGNIRVKYLDQEDIESLGWECKLFNQTYNSGVFVFKNNILSFNLVDYFCIIKHINYPNNVHKNIISIFQGTIKNKSELKKLMQMLNIQTDAK